MRLLHDATRPQNNMGWYGYGFVVGGSGALHHYGHEGGAPGMNGMLEIYSDLRVVIVALSNVDPPAADRVADYYALPEYLPRVLTWGNVVRRSIFMSRDRTIMTFMLLYSAASLAHFMHNAVYLAFYPNMPIWLTPLGGLASWLVIAGTDVSTLRNACHSNLRA